MNVITSSASRSYWVQQLLRILTGPSQTQGIIAYIATRVNIFQDIFCFCDINVKEQKLVFTVVTCLLVNIIMCQWCSLIT